MKNSFSALLSKLQSVLYVFDEESTYSKKSILRELSKTSIDLKHAMAYQESLLFIVTHPNNEDIYQFAIKEIKHLANTIKNITAANIGELQDTGLPHTSMITRFSHDLLSWLINRKDCSLELDSFEEEGTALKDILRITLPPLEHEETTAELSNIEMLDALKIKKANRLDFLLNEFSTLNETATIKDFLWDSLKAFIQIKPYSVRYSRLYNRISFAPIVYQEKLLKKFDHVQLLNQAIPDPLDLSETLLNEVESVIKLSLVLTMRETDPSTYMDKSSLKYFVLERGISIAIYGMAASRQMPLQSYIGYTLFKNGYPISYGGSWVFGYMAMFGLNILEAFRGGESGYIMCQLLRVYKQVFKLQCVEVEPYQYGLDNPDGIRTGAFWFYYKYGFRPLDPQLRKLAESEHQKISTKNKYRSNEKILLRFTENNIALKFSTSTPRSHHFFTAKVSKMIQDKFAGNRVKAVEACYAALMQKLIMKKALQAEQVKVCKDFALIVSSLDIKEAKKLDLIQQMIITKPTDPYRYNLLWQEFLTS
ncbi:MAG: hypothetical protein KA198_03205 [Chitinophagaceae bacterium]|nr:hypothetical protein [Chitinophagaceae bacterium]